VFGKNAFRLCSVVKDEKLKTELTERVWDDIAFPSVDSIIASVFISKAVWFL
jgi:hypothetical protein